MARFTLEDDKYIYAHRDDPVSALAERFDRSNASIRNRLEFLLEPSHNAYKRLMYIFFIFYFV